MRVSALAVGCYREELAFEEVRLDTDDLAGLARAPSSELAAVEALAFVAEARSRDMSLERLRDRVPQRWETLLAALPEGTGTDDVLSVAKQAINAPKVWAAMGALARSLQARAPLPHDEVMEIVGRILEADSQNL